MAVNKGKQFEERVKKDWLESFPGSALTRLYDQVSGYKEVSRNICDFIYHLDCFTSTLGNYLIN